MIFRYLLIFCTFFAPLANANEELLAALKAKDRGRVITLLGNPVVHQIDLDFDPEIRILLREQGFETGLFGRDNNDSEEREIAISLVHFDPDIERLWRLIEIDINDLNRSSCSDILSMFDFTLSPLSMSDREFCFRRHAGWLSYLCLICGGAIYPLTLAALNPVNSPGVGVGSVLVVTIAGCAGQFAYSFLSGSFEEIRNERQDAKSALRSRIHDLGRALFRIYVENLQLIGPLFSTEERSRAFACTSEELDALLRTPNAVSLAPDHLYFEHLEEARRKIERLLEILSVIFPDSATENSSLDQIRRLLFPDDLRARQLFFELVYFEASADLIIDKQRKAIAIRKLINLLELSDERLLQMLRTL